MDSIEEHVGKAGSQLQQWAARLDELMAKAVEVGEDVKSDGHERIEALKVKHAAAQAKLTELEAAGSDKWETFKSDIETAMDEVETAFKKLKN